MTSLDRGKKNFSFTLGPWRGKGVLFSHYWERLHGEGVDFT